MKQLYSLLLALALLCLPLAGLAESIDALPETYEALRAMLPDLPDSEPENVAVRFPAGEDYSVPDTDHLELEIYCDNAQWEGAAGSIGGFSLNFIYHDEKGAYGLMDQESRQKIQMAVMTGTGTGGVALAGHVENDWKRNLVIYFDQEALSQLLWESPDTWNFNATMDGDNYIMPCLRLQKQVGDNIVEVQRYADHAAAYLFDGNHNVLDQKTYPETSPFCEQFAPLAPEM